MTTVGSPFLRNLFVTVLLFGLFSEWLRPLASMAEATDMYRLLPFLGALAFYMAIDAGRLHGAIGWPLKLVFTALWIGYWFQPEALSSGRWLLDFPALVLEDASGLLSGVWLVSPETRTLLFLAGWAALAYAVQRIVTERGQALWFVGSTLLFLVLLQLWPGLDTTGGILRSAAFGLLLLTTQHGTKWERLLGNRFAESRGAALSRIAAGALCAAIALGSGYGLSAREPAAVEPVSLERWADWARSAATSRGEGTFASALPAATGYGVDDSRLGRAVSPDDALAFTATTELATYWRGESKDVYTGRGWRSSALGETAATFRAAEAPEGAVVISQQVDVLSRALERNVFAGGQVLRFPELTDDDGARLSDIHLRYDAEDGSYFVGTNAVRLGSYRMETALAASDPSALVADGSPETDISSARYLQLPGSLPQRVRDLARDIVRDVPAHPYLQAVAVQSYLQEHYRYTLETDVPPEGADFVDHFLFDAEEGYCNHFSTAMVVLLRSIGVEARWVKGFAPGTPDPDRPGTYAVRQSDAHSWVEVRFADAGWVPFEATPPASAEGVEAGFAGLGAEPANMLLPQGTVLAAAAAAATATASATASAGDEAETGGGAASAEAWLASARERLRGGLDAAAAAFDAAARRVPREWAAPLGWALAGGATAAAALGAAFALARLVRGAAPGYAAFPAPPQRRRLDRLWRRLYRRHGPRTPEETLRDYAARLPAETPEARAALLELVRRDEAIRYGGGSGRPVSRRWVKDVWRTIAKRAK
ncbi:transglutaminase domain-containing protein [Paenibacillus antri]|uniref:Transglutaminase domain-containing protein n=1 Tax=Paenibacillus antri TaxID=2582848 RepID=A0A5R9GAM8_9BACL|nr:transglutaminase domain-containing protein [Paenibacillus antri]TLS52119.1 transglutaminase domain-containing protein [Paenibacillus antri]